MDMVTFVGRDSKHCTVEVRFATTENTTSHATKILRSEVILLPTYKSRRSVRLRVGRVIPEIKLESVTVAVLSTTEETPEIVSVSKINSLKW